MANIADYYRALFQTSMGVLDEMLNDTEATEALIKSHNYILDYDCLRSAISERPEASVLDAAVREYQFALFALASGRYRHAFVGLRLFFELMLVTIQFSAHEIDYRMWSKDTKDINWNSIKSTDTGVFSANFINAFNCEFSEFSKQYSAIAEAVYRECSEFVHGNAKTHISLPSDISLNKDICLSWHDKSRTMRLVIIFAFSARYLNYIDSVGMNAVEHPILDALGHLAIVQDIFAKPPQE